MQFPERIPTLSEALGNLEFLETWDNPGWTIYPPWQAENEGEPEWAEMLRRVPSYLLDDLLISEYGDRPVSKMFLRTAWDPDSNKFTQPNVTALAGRILLLRYASWARLTKDYLAEYEPVENYSMQEGGTDSTKKKGANASTTGTADATLTHSTEGTDASASIGTLTDYEITNTPAQGYTQQQASTYDSELKDRVKETYTNTTPGSTKENGKRGAAGNYEDNEVRNHTFNRHGNIGVMTATQMIENDSEFWSANDFFSRILADVASIITVPIYE